MRRRRLDVGEFVLKALLRHLEIVADLHVEVYFWRSARQPGKPQRHLGGDRRGPVQHGMDGLTRHAHAAGSFGNRQIHVFFEDLSHEPAGMHR